MQNYWNVKRNLSLHTHFHYYLFSITKVYYLQLSCINKNKHFEEIMEMKYHIAKYIAQFFLCKITSCKLHYV